jgi:hypothetical protein
VLPVPNAGSATATIDVPGEQADVHVLGGLILRRASAERPHDDRRDADARHADRVSGGPRTTRAVTRPPRATCGCSPT